MVQYGYELDMGRRGASLSLFRMNKQGMAEYVWEAIFNSRGIRIGRTGNGGQEVFLTDFETFLYPDRIEEDELDLIDVLSGAPVKEDRDVVRLCSFLVAKWAAGHDEESFHDAIRSTIKTWSERTTE